MTLFLKNCLFFLFLVLVGSGCTQLPVVSPELLRVAIPKNQSSLLVVLAQRENYFADAGLKVELVPFNNPEETFEQLSLSNVDLAVTDTSSLAFSERQNIKILSEVYSTTRSLYLVAFESKAKNLSDLPPMPLLVHPRSAEEWFINLMSIAEGLDSTKHPIVTVPNTTGTKQKPRKEALVMNSVELARLRAKQGSSSVSAFSSRVHIEVAFVAAKENFKKDATNNDKLVRFLWGLAKAEDRFHKDRVSGERALIQFLPELDPSDVRKIMSGSFFRLGITNTLYVLLDEQVRWARTRFQIRTQPTLDIKAAIFPDYLRSVRPRSVTLSDQHFGVGR